MNNIHTCHNSRTSPTRGSRGTRGSSLFVVVIIATALGIGVVSTLSLVQGEFQRNHKAEAYHEAKLAVESLLQSSMADLKSRFDRQTAFPVDSLAPSKNPLSISSEFVGIYNASDADSHLVIPNVLKYSSKDDFNSQETEVIGGQVPPGHWHYIEPFVPGNQYDELAGTRVFERNIEIVAKATVDRPNIGKSTVFARQFLQVRDAPLFAYAIFYNLPMEIAPGPQMDIYGNVHVNWDAWIQAGTGLNFHAKYTSGGKMYHGRHLDSGKSNDYSPVRFMNISGDLVSMQEDSTWPTDTADLFDGGWLTSDATNFVELTNQLYGGNVQTGDHGVLPQNPVGVSDYIEDTDTTTDRKESFNSAYNLIQPVLKESALAIPDKEEDKEGYDAAKALNEVEEQKFAYKAGLTIQVDDDGDLRYYTYDRHAEDDKLKYEDDGSPKLIELTPAESIATYSGTYREDDGDVERGLYEKRQAKELRTIELDVAKLKDLVHPNEMDDWGGQTERAPEEWWNGVVYVDFPTEHDSSDRDDNVNPAKTGWGLKVVNGGTIPNPKFAHSKDTYGMSLATNQMMYIEGHYNADGDFDTGSPVAPDDPTNFGKEGYEAPAALIADSITFLSTNWDDEDSASSLDDRRAANTEVSAAILTGLVPSGETGSARYSGGVENFPRFLEKWGGKTLLIRGSMVALFESEVGTRGWGYSDVYNAPKREWGFHDKFAEGYLPPGTPNARRYRAVDFKLINEDEYAKHIERIKTYF